MDNDEFKKACFRGVKICLVYIFIIILIIYFSNNRTKALRLICIWSGPSVCFFITILTFLSLTSFRKPPGLILLGVLGLALLSSFFWLISPLIIPETYHLYLSIFLSTLLFWLFVFFDKIAIDYKNSSVDVKETSALLKYVDGPTAFSLLLFGMVALVIKLTGALPKDNTFNFFCHGALSFHIFFALFLLVWSTPQVLYGHLNKEIKKDDVHCNE